MYKSFGIHKLAITLILATQASAVAGYLPASNEDIFLYRGMGSSYVCNARTAGVPFPKAVGIAAATYVQLLNGRHGGKVASTGMQKLSNDQLFAGSEFQIITGAMQFCPNAVPSLVKSKVNAALRAQKNGSASNGSSPVSDSPFNWSEDNVNIRAALSDTPFYWKR